MNKVVSGVAFNYVIIFSNCVIYIIFPTDLITGLFSLISSSIFVTSSNYMSVFLKSGID